MRHDRVALILLAGLGFSPASAETVVVPFWTPVPVRFTQMVSSKDAILGQMVPAEIAEDVTVDGQVVFRKGMPVWADVCDVKKKAGFGVPGSIEVKVVFAPAGGNSLHIAGRIKSRGEAGGANLAVAGVAFGLTGVALVTGRSGEIPAGTTLLAHVDEEKAVQVDRGAAAYKMAAAQ